MVGSWQHCVVLPGRELGTARKRPRRRTGDLPGRCCCLAAELPAPAAGVAAGDRHLEDDTCVDHAGDVLTGYSEKEVVRRLLTARASDVGAEAVAGLRDQAPY